MCVGPMSPKCQEAAGQGPGARRVSRGGLGVLPTPGSQTRRNRSLPRPLGARPLGLREPRIFLREWVESPDKTQEAELNLNFKQGIVFQAKYVPKI